jgi:hypothetical protein
MFTGVIHRSGLLGDIYELVPTGEGYCSPINWALGLTPSLRCHVDETSEKLALGLNRVSWCTTFRD